MTEKVAVVKSIDIAVSLENFYEYLKVLNLGDYGNYLEDPNICVEKISILWDAIEKIVDFIDEHDDQELKLSSYLGINEKFKLWDMSIDTFNAVVTLNFREFREPVSLNNIFKNKKGK